jgi:hypothetical protein
MRPYSNSERKRIIKNKIAERTPEMAAEQRKEYLRYKHNQAAAASRERDRLDKSGGKPKPTK